MKKLTAEEIDKRLIEDIDPVKNLKDLNIKLGKKVKNDNIR